MNPNARAPSFNIFMPRGTPLSHVILLSLLVVDQGQKGHDWKTEIWWDWEMTQARSKPRSRWALACCQYVDSSQCATAEQFIFLLMAWAHGLFMLFIPYWFCRLDETQFVKLCILFQTSPHTQITTQHCKSFTPASLKLLNIYIF